MTIDSRTSVKKAVSLAADAALMSANPRSGSSVAGRYCEAICEMAAITWLALLGGWSDLVCRRN